MRLSRSASGLALVLVVSAARAALGGHAVEFVDTGGNVFAVSHRSTLQPRDGTQPMASGAGIILGVWTSTKEGSGWWLV